MKHFLTGVLTLIVGLLIGAIYLNWPSEWRLKDEPPQTTEELTVSQQIQEFLDPSFENSNDVLLFRRALLQDAYIDSVFYALPNDVLENVAAVVINKQGRATKETIVVEYSNNSEVYNNLPPPDAKATDSNSTAPTTTVTSTSSGGEPDRSTQAESENDSVTINGKTYYGKK